MAIHVGPDCNAAEHWRNLHTCSCWHAHFPANCSGCCSLRCRGCWRHRSLCDPPVAASCLLHVWYAEGPRGVGQALQAALLRPQESCLGGWPLCCAAACRPTASARQGACPIGGAPSSASGDTAGGVHVACTASVLAISARARLVCMFGSRAWLCWMLAAHTLTTPLLPPPAYVPCPVCRPAVCTWPLCFRRWTSLSKHAPRTLSSSSANSSGGARRSSSRHALRRLGGTGMTGMRGRQPTGSRQRHTTASIAPTPRSSPHKQQAQATTPQDPCHTQGLEAMLHHLQQPSCGLHR